MKRKIHSLLLTALVLVTFVMAGFAQIQRDGTPPSVIFNYTSAIDALDYSPNVDVRAMMQEDEILAKQGVPERAGFVQPVGINMTSSGVWTRLPGNRMMWQVKLIASEAKALGVVFENFYIPDGAELYLYDENKTMIIGAFTSDNNNEDMVFSTHILPGTTIWVEYVEPIIGESLNKQSSSEGNRITSYEGTIPQSFVIVNNYRPIGSFIIKELIYVYRDYIFNQTKDLGDSEACQVNINCSPVGDTWQSAKRGVARILFREGASWYYCSGTLVNNTAVTGQPYFLTANHCGATASAADKNVWQFYFNYERPGCPNSGTPANNMITGCAMRSTGDITGGTDFQLVLLNSNVPLAWNPYFNGWDRTTTASSAGASIHHPSGDAKKISTYTTALTTATWNGTVGMANGHWRVVWASNANGFGCTEGGSSGSPIFNGTTKRVVGTLTGGSSTCATPTSGDFYGKFSLHWEANGGTSASQLKPWLDPLGTNPTFLDGYDPNSVSAPPVANFSGTPLTVVAGQTVQFTDLSTNYPTQWSWTFNNGFPSTATNRNPTCTWSTPGTYTISLTATNAFGSHTVTKTAYITVTAYSCGTANPVIIGTGTSTQEYPLGVVRGYERSASIYLASEVGRCGYLESIAWFPTTARTTYRPIKIYVKHTTATALTADTWANMITGATLVYDDSTTVPTANVWQDLLCNINEFYYNGTNNLLVLVEQNRGANSNQTTANRYTTATNRHQFWRNNANPISPPTGNGTISSNRPNARITFKNYAAAPVADFVANNKIEIFSEGFDGTWLPTNWSVINTITNATYQWKQGNPSAKPFSTIVPSSTNSAIVMWQASTPNSQNEWIISPEINTSSYGGQPLRVSFYMGFSRSWLNPGATCSFKISTNNGATWTELWNAIGDNSVPTGNQWDWRYIERDIAAYAGQNLKFAWQYIGNDGDLMGLDGVQIFIQDPNPTSVTIFEGETVSFIDKSTNNPSLWEWTNPGSTILNTGIQNPVKQYNIAGTYNVSLKAANPAGSDTKTRNNYVIVVGRAPIAKFKAKGNLKTINEQPFIPVGGTVLYNDISDRVPTSWNWAFTGGTPASSTAQNPTAITYNSPGLYNTSLQATNATGTDTKIITDFVKVTGTDFVTNLDTTDALAVYLEDNGYIPGHSRFVYNSNTYSSYQWAEFFANAYQGQVTKVLVAVRYAQGTGKTITLTVWDGSTGLPGTVLGSKVVDITSFTEQQYNTITFDTPINVTGDFFVGYQLNYDATHNFTTHQFCPYMAISRPAGSVNTAYVKLGTTTANAVWYTTEDLYGLRSSISLEPEFTYAYSGPIATVSATPGCGTGTVTVTSSENTNQTFYLTDDAGTTLQTWTGTAISRAFTGLANGTYRGKVMIGAQTSPLSASVVLTNNVTTAITTQPTSQTVCPGASVTFTVVATGSTLTYQWRKGGTNITGATSASYTIPAVAAGDAGNYDVVVTGACGTVTSTAATLTVNAATAITTQPTSQTICAGSSVTFSVVATGTTLTYQWRKGGTNIGGATSASYTIPSVVAGDAGSYDVVVTGACGTVTSAAATLTVNAATAITTQPLSQTVCAGTNVSFTVVATGAGLTYQWRKDGSNIGGATSATYSITGVAAGNAGNYDVVVTGTCGTVTSNVAVLTVNAATAITTQPTSQTVCAGASVTFSVTATGTGLTYQWRKGGVNIGGATSATYTIPSTVVGDAGSYDVVVTGTCGTVTSAAATLTVNANTAITVQPLTQTVCAGTNVTFSVTATGAGLTYQWRKGGANISGATSASYSITGVVAGDAGSYDVVVTGTCGTVTSTAATLTVNAATIITGQPTSQTVCAGSAVTFTVTATGTGLTYQWRKNGTNIGGATAATYNIASTVAGDAGNYDVVVTGTCGTVNSAVATLTVNAVTAITTQPLSQTVCAGTNVTFTVTATGAGLTYQWRKGGVNIGGATSATYTITGVVAGDAGNYTVVVTGTCGTVTSNVAVLTVNAATAITTQPLSQTVCAGTNVTFSVTATGAGLTYQWRKGGANISGATSATYTITGVAAGDAGNYDVVVTGTCGNVTSAVATLTVNALTAITTQPLSQTVCAGTNVTFTVTATGAGLTYQWRKGGANISGATSATYTITGVAAGDAGNYDVVVTGTCGNVTSNVAVLTVNAATVITTQPLSQTVCAGTNVAFTVAATGTGLTYQWRKGGANISGATSATYTITGVAAGDAGNYDVVVTGTCGNVTSNVATLTVNAVTAITTQPLSQTVCAGTNVTFSVTATGTTLTYQWRKNGTNITGATSATYSITGVAAGDAGNYTVVVTGACGTVTSNIAVLTVNAVTAITTQPLSQTVCPGASVTFSVTATGTGLTYQWRKGGANIGGATSASYTIPSVAAGDAGSYDVVVTGTCGNVTSAAATLTVNANTAITTQPVSQTVCPGASVTFSVAANGTALTYQWRKGGTNIGGATSASYTIPSVAAGDAGSYDVVVTGTCGNVTSAAATLTVNANTAITTQPLSQTVCQGANVSFTVAANGTTLTYQWRKGGTNIPGATSATYTISGAGLADAGNFDVVVTGACGTVTSNVAVLTVNANTVITTQPSSQTACVGTNVTFTVVATGTGLTYQWRKGGTNIGGATSATYTISGVVAGDAGNYDVVITGACGNVTSAVATLTISATLTLTSPTNQAVCPGATATFTVIANGSNPTYVWKKNGTVMVNGGNIAGVNTATLTISNVAAGDVAAYTCDVTSDCGNATSVAANLTLNSATVITTQPTNQTVCAGANASFTVAATGSGTLTYQWQKGGVNIPGANATTFTITGVTAGDAGNYTCVVTGDCGNATSNVAVLTVNAVTAITTQPLSQTICEGQDVTFTVAAAGAGLNYQWRKDGANIGGATSATYTITGTTLAAAGNYDVVVTGTCGNATSNVAVLTVNANVTITTQPASLTLCAGDNANFSVVVSGTVVSYQWRKGGTNISGATSATYTLSGITAGDAGSYDVVITGTCGNVTSSAAILTVNALTVITTQPLSQTICEGANVTFTVAATGSGLTYQWKKGGTDISGATSATYTISGVAMGDAGNYTCVVTGTCGTVTSNTAVLTVNANVLVTGQPADLTLCAGDNASFSVTVSGTATAYQWRKGGTNISGATSATYTISGVAAGDAGNYDVVITGPCGNVTSNVAVLTVNPAVAITTQPLSETVCEGANVTLTVVAAGSGLTYQWKKGGTDISGATSATYTITGVAMGDAGNYTCVVTGDCGTVTSNTAVLTVNANVLVTDQPDDLTLCTGDNATFSVTVSGTATAYQWRKDGVNITGATSSFYTISGIAAGDAGSYDVVITGPCGNITSTAATLVVNTPVSITTQPAAQAVCDGTDATFTVVAAGSGLTYQWQFGGVDISGATSATLTVTGATATDAGNYTCIVTGDCGSVTTAAAALTIDAATAIVDNPASQTVCEGANVTLTINATGEALAYQWYLDGTAVTGATSANLTLSAVTLAEAGSYTCEVTGACGTLTSATATLAVNANTAITTQPVAVTICEGGNANFNVVATGNGLSYQWRFNNVDITGATTASYSITGAVLADAGSYDVVITGDCGMVTSDAAILTVNEIPQLFVTSVNASCGASDGSASVSVVGGTGTYTYLWSDASAQTTETATGLGLGTYYVTVNDGNCSATGNVDVAENGAPVVTIFPMDTTVCEGESITITANGADTYVWTPALYLDNDNTGVVVCTPEATTTYTVTGTTAGCSAQAQITVTFSPLPVAGFTYITDMLTIYVTDASQNATTWEYNMGDGTVLTDQSPTYTYVASDTYTVLQTVTNSCGTDTISEVITVIDIAVPFVEDGISFNLYPNPGNGICNLVFEAPAVDKYTVRLISHNGQIVYTETFTKTQALSLQQFDFSNQAMGAYRLQLIYNGKALQTPLIINKY